MRIATTFRPQLGGSYESIADATVAAERLGFDTIFLPDHLLSTPDFHRADAATAVVPEAPRDVFGERGAGPTDVWTILAGLARDTSTIRLGTLMTNATFRHPAMLAVSVAVANEVSGGRIDFGVGTGWFATEHEMYGIDFPPLGERFDRLGELFEVVYGLWSTGRFSHTGGFLSLHDALPVSVSAGIPRAWLLTGGKGMRRTPALAARYCDEVNAAFDEVDQAMTFFRACDEACERIDRDPASLKRSVSMRVQCGEDDADLRRMTAAMGTTVEETGQVHFVGTPDQLIPRLEAFEEAGLDRIVLARRLPVDLRGLELLGETVVPRFHGDPTAGADRS